MGDPVWPRFSDEIHIKSNPGGNWRVKRHAVKRTGNITFTCDVDGCHVWVMFPDGRTPLASAKTQEHGDCPLTVTIEVASGKEGVYPYCVLVQDSNQEFHLVEGISPPELIICP